MGRPPRRRRRVQQARRAGGHRDPRLPDALQARLHHRRWVQARHGHEV